eukprot:TRINITY_DN17390_c0_g1_i1.p1 TRINITY_DN17390_c0_g1~~TRINITY_DN17390_c0_g1_i1.p1  ORF type:complete len:786 (-),score=218.96 TRINITY_DN17390_c0_g1_i1:188-2500(-)
MSQDVSVKVVSTEAFQMKRSIDDRNLMQALKHASQMLNELRTGLLTPRNYEDIYRRIFDELRYLESFFKDLVRSEEHTIISLYEKVQRCGNVLPRSYLLITVGAVFLKSEGAPVKEILRDLVEMSKGVQDPMRGLFLRDYLLHMTKDKLPDKVEAETETSGTIQDSISFILTNFGEMTRLWVRMQKKGGKGRKRREKERRELRLLIGNNLVRLSKLEGMNLEIYKKNVLPQILEEVVNCEDRIAQEYLMESIVQVFPNEFHVWTLDAFLNACVDLQHGIDINEIFCIFMGRLAEHVLQGEGSIPEAVKAFQLFFEYTSRIIESRSDMPFTDVLSLQISLMNFCLSIYPHRLDYVDRVLGFCLELFRKTTEPQDDDVYVLVTRVMTIPIEPLAIKILKLANFPDLLALLPGLSRKEVAIKLLKAILLEAEPLTSPEMVAQFLGLISPLIRDEEGIPDSDQDEEAFEEEQQLVASHIHLIQNEDTDTHFRMLGTARKFFGHGGARRIAFTLSPLVFASLALARRIMNKQQGGVSSEKPLAFSARRVFQFIHEICTALAASHPQLSLRLFLQSVLASDECHYEAIAYEFFTQAFILYEDQLVDSKLQLDAIERIIGSLEACRNFDPSTGNHDTLITRATQYSAKLLRKEDQCRMVARCSHLFWRGKDQPPQNSQRLLECLQRALRIADICMPASPEFFISILNRYMYFFEHECATIVPKYIRGLLALVNEHLENMEPSEDRRKLEKHFKNTIKHIDAMKERNKLYKDISVEAE